MVHTFEILYILNIREATYCTYKLLQNAQAYKLNQRNKNLERMNRDKIRAFLRQIHIRKKHEGIRYKGFHIPGILQMNLLKYKSAPGNFFLYITIEPEVLLTGENTLDTYFCSFPNLRELQTKYAQAIYALFPKAFEGKPLLSQVRFHDQKRIHPVEYSFGRLFMIPHLGLSILSRIDFCANYKLENATLYVEMIRKSYYHTRKKNIKFKNLNPFSENNSNDALFYDKTSGFCIYDKYNKMMNPAKDNMHNIEQIREDAKNVIRIERPFYKISKEKLFSMTGLIVPKAIEGREAPLKLGPLPFLCEEKIGLNTIFKEYIRCVLGIKATQKYDIVNRQNFKWVSLKRFVREMDRLYEAGRITKQRHDTVLKMAYATSEARSVKRAVHNCDIGTHINWGHDEEGNRIRIPFQRSADNFRSTWQTMHELGMMLFRIPDDRVVLGVEDNDWEARELDANFIFDSNNMVAIGTIYDKAPSSDFGFLPYRFVRGRGLDTSNPLEIRKNYDDIQTILRSKLGRYIENSQKAAEERERRNNSIN